MEFTVFFEILLTTIVATSAMTIFSYGVSIFTYGVSASFEELYKEPVLLTFILKKMNFQTNMTSKITIGWLTHYAIGFFFVLAYHIIWINNFLKMLVGHTLLLGVVSGIIGVFSWMLLFKITHYQPIIDFKAYYIQLFFAHIIFTVTATLTYHITLIVSLLADAYVTI